MRPNTLSNDLHTVDPINVNLQSAALRPAHPHPHSANEYPALCPVCVSSSTTSSSSTSDDDDDSSPTTPAPSELSADDHATERQGRVRFRERVRITSGLKGPAHTHRGSRSDPAAEYIDIALPLPRRSSPSPSPSSSRSSSISVPLRNEIDYADAKPGWGTLGQRVNIMAQHHAERKMLRDQRYRELLAKNYQLGLRFPRAEYGSERTPLMKPDAFLKLYMSRDDTAHDRRNLTATEREQYRERKIDQAFGPWPHRLWNHHWWWWHIEPVICCHYCVDEFEDEHC